MGAVDVVLWCRAGDDVVVVRIVAEGIPLMEGKLQKAIAAILEMGAKAFLME